MIVPDIASPEDAVCAVVAFVFNVPGAAFLVKPHPDTVDSVTAVGTEDANAYVFESIDPSAFRN